jgi:Carboxypeptidase regulatory-like domain
MQHAIRVAAVLAALSMAPAAAFAQASIAGVVKDASGAVLPGVTVEASSPVLIEKTRSAVTDGGGAYRIVDLRAGTYTVTFTLLTPGANTKIWDFNFGIGGPIRKDRIWFFFTARDEGSHRTVPGMFANLNAGEATKWTYVKDTTRPAAVAASFRPISLRLTTK